MSLFRKMYATMRQSCLFDTHIWQNVRRTNKKKDPFAGPFFLSIIMNLKRYSSFFHSNHIFLIVCDIVLFYRAANAATHSSCMDLM